MSEIGSEHSDTQGDNLGIELTGNMFEEILTKSSVDSLMTFKLVCKFWHDLIRGQSLINLQLKHSNKNNNYIICRLDEDPSTIIPVEGVTGRCTTFGDITGTEICMVDNDFHSTTIFPLPQFLQGLVLRVVSSFNGLLFITCDLPDNELQVFTCNPATRKLHWIPDGSPSAVKPTVGIAYNLKTCQYKVFQFFKDLLEPKEDCYACEVYTPVTKSWRRIESVRYRPIVTLYTSSNDHICVDGTLYWFGFPKEAKLVTIGPACIMSVDMNDEKFKTIDFPGCLKDSQVSFLINLEGRVSLVTVDCPKLCLRCPCGPGMPDSPAQAHLWVAEDLGQSNWFLKTSFVINVDRIDNFRSVVACKSDIFFIIVDIDDVLHYHIYHVTDSTWTVLDQPQCGYHPLYQGWPVAFPFAESLCPCGGDDRFFYLIPPAREIEERSATGPDGGGSSPK